KALASKGDYQRAIDDLDESILVDPGGPTAWTVRGTIRYHILKEYGPAVTDLKEAIRLNPKDPLTRNYLACLLATCPYDRHRDGGLAVEHATKACELTDWRDLQLIDTLAAAFAEAGDFDKAVKYQVKALGLSKDEKEKASLRGHLDLYKANRPVRDTPKE